MSVRRRGEVIICIIIFSLISSCLSLNDNNNNNNINNEEDILPLLLPLCYENNSLPWISWCSYNNPTIVPLPYNLSSSYFDKLSPSCNEDDIYSSCSYITSIAAADIYGGPQLYFSDGNNCIYKQNPYTGVYIATCGYNSTYSTFIKSLVIPGNVSYVSFGTGNSANYDYNSPTMSGNNFWYEPGIILDQFLVPFPSYSSTAMLSLSIITDFSSISLSFRVVDNAEYSLSQGVWSMIDLDYSRYSSLQFSLTPFYSFSSDYNFNNSFNYNSSSYNYALLVRDGNEVNIVVLDLDNIQLDLNITFGSSSPNVTTFYEIENQNVDTVALWAESQPRYINYTTFYPSSLLWLLVGGTNGTSSLQMIALNEYQNYPNMSPVDTNRTIITLDLPEPASQIETRFVNKYDNINVQTYNINNIQLNVRHYEFFIAMSRSMVIYAVQIYEDSLNELMIDLMNTLTYAGNLLHVFVSYNAQHIFATTDRTQWEMEGMGRFYEICETLKNSSTDAIELEFLQPYQAQCDAGYRKPTFMDFTQYAGVCLSLVQCPTFSLLQVNEVPRGYYTTNTFTLTQCQPGSYCVSGMQQPCPKGFVCPEYGMTVPTRCDFNPDYDTTCYGDGLIAPQPCPEGMSCPTPYMPGFPSPPGFCAPNGTRTYFGICTPGDYCNLGMGCNSSNILCPLGTYCESPDEMVPTVCSCSAYNNTCSYCQPGSAFEVPCPAGNYCPGPNATVTCEPSQYCPSGVASPKPCTAGYYCPTPAQLIICPKGFFCPESSIAPKKCAFFSLCRPGSIVQTGNYGMPLFGALAILALIGAWKSYSYYRSKNPKKVVPVKEEKKPLLYTPAEEGLQEKSFTIDIEFNKLGLTIGTKQVLSGVTGTIQHARVTAVMGPSGAGKTTFLTTLADKVSAGKVSGSIYINGKRGSLGQYKEIVGFVPQEDIMLRQMTVEENLLFAARTRLPAGMSDVLRTKQVNAVIDVLGLKDVRESQIGDEITRGVSGGQRKRVNIGMELVADPTVLFLDEPTSGLDSTSSREVLAALRKIAELGITIVTVIHQPRYEIFTMFHDVLLLGKGGRTVYLGESGKALQYFAKLGFTCPPLVNPPDFFLDVISGEVPREGYPNFAPPDLFDLWEEHKRDYETSPLQGRSINNDNEDVVIRKFSCKGEERPVYRVIPGFFSQFWYFFIRALVQQLRNVPGLVLDMLLVASSGLFLGIIFANTLYQGPPPPDVCSRLMLEQLIERCNLPLDDPIGTIASLTCLSVALTAVASSLRVFGNERVIYWREASWGLDTLAYFLGKDFAQIPSMLLQPLVFLAVYCTIVSTQAPFWHVYLIILIVQFTSVGIGYLVSIMINSSLAQLVGVVFVLVSMMFSGARPTLSELKEMIFPLPYMPNLSFIRWAQEGFYLTEIREYRNMYDVEPGMAIWSYNFNHFHLDIIMTVLLGFMFRVIALVLLYVMDRHKKK